MNKKAPMRRIFEPEAFHLACEAILVFTLISIFTQPEDQYYPTNNR
jgi:hypothetical protein